MASDVLIKCSEREQPEHHSKKDMKSPLEDLPIDMIFSFPSSNPLHLLEMGVMKKCFIRWIVGFKKNDNTFKWSQATTKKVSQILKSLNRQIPSDIHRALRSLDQVKYFKGTEFRTLLLYVGMVVLKDVLSENEYLLFLTLCCAARICYSNEYRKYFPVASKLFQAYVLNYGELYGKHMIGSNVHNLLHITEDLEKLNVGSLIDISTYKYENCLRLLGLGLKKCNLPLEQISRRLIVASKVQPPLSFHNEGFVPFAQYEYKFEDITAYKSIHITPNMTLSSRNDSNSWFLTRNFDIVKMRHIIRVENSFRVYGNRLQNKTDFFTKPLSSQILHIFLSNGQLNDEMSFYSLKQIMSKMMCLNSKQNFVFIPILHTIKSK